ncbi:MAG TPA: glycoside hydrolase family 76 protein [Firmicutes bacterium]|nr:glycoside hydrolase family 76 protein [Bacillota bacterium]
MKSYLGILVSMWIVFIGTVTVAAAIVPLDDIEHWADLATQALIDQYWAGSNSPFRGFGWGNAQAWDALMDAVERTGGTASPYYPYIDELFRRQNAINPTFINEFNDDMAWWALASLRAYRISGDTKYLNRALLLWNTILRSWDEELGGGIWWRNDQKGAKNACINCPASILASKLYQITGEEQYLEWAMKLYHWVKENLAPTGLVWDNKNRSGNIWEATFTYNQGTYIGAAVELYKNTGDPQYLADARRTAQLTMSRLTDQRGILKDEGQGDGGGFKGICVRYFVSLIEVDPEPEVYIDFLVKNAVSVGENAFNQLNLIGPNWTKPETGPVQLLTHVSGVMLLNLTARVLAEEAACGITILTPAWGANVMVDEPIQFQLSADLDVEELVVLENEVEVYRGPVPLEPLYLSLPIGEEGEERKITVRAIDSSGEVRQRSTRCRVYRLCLDLPETEQGPVQGELSLGLAAAFPRDSVAQFQLILLGIGEGLADRREILFAGEQLPPEFVLETMLYPDGAYDLMLVALDGDHQPISQLTRRLLIQNWEILQEAFRSPVDFFGIKMDTLLAKERSAGWVFRQDTPEEFYGDAHRIEAVGSGEEYLIWYYPGLSRFVLTVYAQDESLLDALEIYTFSGSQQWQLMDRFELTIQGQGSPWQRYQLTGELAGGADHLVIVVQNVPGKTPPQLGDLVLMRPAGAAQ